MAINFKANSIQERWKEQIGGTVLVLLGAYITYYVWDAVTLGKSYFRIAVGGPGFMVLGLALILIPSYRLERIVKGERVDDSHNVNMMTPRWWVVLGLSFLVSILFVFYINTLKG